MSLPSKSALRRELRRMARDFADELVEVLDEHGIWDEPEIGEDAALEPKRVRRSAEALETLKRRVLGRIRAHGEPVAISTIAAEMALPPREIAHPLAMLVAEGKLDKSGVRRGTRYRASAPSRKASGRKKKTRKKKAGKKRPTR